MATYYPFKPMGVGYTLQYFFDGFYHHAIFRKGTEQHRTDGPSHIQWNDDESVVQYFFAINGRAPMDSSMMDILKEHIENMPLYINHYFLKEVAKDRLDGNKTTIVSNLDTEILAKIKRLAWVL